MLTSGKIMGAGGLGGDTYWFNVLDRSNNYVTNNGLVTDSLNNTYVSGQMLGTAGVYCPFIAKYDPDGVLLWSKKLGDFSGGGGNINFLTVDSSDNVIAAGDYNDGARTSGSLMKLDSSGNAIWHRIAYGSYSYNSFRQSDIDSSGNIYVVGKISVSPYDVGVVMKFNSSGTLQWQRQTSGDAGTYHNAVCASPSGDVFVGGNCRDTGGYTNAILMQFNTSGAAQWLTTQGFPKSNHPSGGYTSMQYSDEGSGYVYICGYEKANTSDADALTFKKIQANSVPVFTRKLSIAPAQLYAGRIALDSNNNAYISCHERTYPLYPVSFRTGYVKYSSDGVFDFARQLTGYTGNAYGRGVHLNSKDTLHFATGADTTDGTDVNGLTLKVPSDGSLTGSIGSGVTYSALSASDSASSTSTQTNLYSISTCSFTVASATTSLQDAGLTNYNYPL